MTSEATTFKPYVISNGRDPMYGDCYRIHCGKVDYGGEQFSKFIDVFLRIKQDGTYNVYCIMRNEVGIDVACQPELIEAGQEEYDFALSMILSYLHGARIKMERTINSMKEYNEN